MATIKDVAKRVDVSIATVSNVFNNPSVVSLETISRVRKAAEELDYHPSRIARGLVESKTRMIGVVVPDINNLVYSETVKAIETTLRSNDYSMLLICTEYDFTRSQEAVRYLLENKVDGAIFSFSAAAISADCITQMVKHQVPVVGIDIHSEMIDTVQIDVVSGVANAVSHLISLGHSKIGFISGDLHNGPITRRANQRFEGYVKALQLNNLPLDPSMIYSEGVMSFELGKHVMQSWIERKRNIPTAVFAARDDVATGVIVAAVCSGMELPRDLSVVGYANYYYSAFSIPPLTTINAPAYQTGQLCAKLILKRINDPMGQREKITLPAELILRSSTAAPQPR